MNKTLYRIFKSGSRTYFYSSVFFPARIREDVFALYSFVRKADNFVDEIPQQPQAFYAFRESYARALQGAASSDIVIDSFVALVRRKSFDPQWIEAFLNAMAMDLTKQVYDTLDETLAYMYGSAEVIGLMMARILDLHPDSYAYARGLGRSMQYINFIRDIDEDLSLGRTYLPLAHSGLQALDHDHAWQNRPAFERFVRRQISLYREWQQEAERGFAYIPRRYLIPIQTASDMYKWTATTIFKDPLIIFRRKVKPTVPRILGTVLKNSLAITGRRPEMQCLHP